MTLDNILEEIKKAEKIVILAHETPDGDAIGTVILLSKDATTKMTDVEQKVVQSAASFLGTQMEL